jgi:exopolysaccharide biosynthesis polyprenyl glycosylphosphotransferase
MRIGMDGQYKRLFNIFATLVLLALETVLFGYFWFTYFSNMGGVTFIAFRNKGNIAMIGIYILILFFFTRTLGGYKVGYLKVSDVCISHVIAVVCTNIVEYAELCIVLYNFISPMRIMVLSLIEIVLSMLWAYVFRTIYLGMYPPHNMLFIYGDRVQTELIEKINARGDKFDIKDTMSINEGLDCIYAEAARYESVIIGDIPATQRNDLVKFCFDKDIRAYITPKISDIIIGGAEEINLFDTPLLLSKNYAISAEKLFVKRLMDIVISLVGLIILSPFMVITAILIKCYDGGPVFYRQERLTRGRRTFNILKFRSMTVDSGNVGARITAKNDSRVTPVGRVIRRLHFDEVPQLINILKGDMAFVGPRPEWVFTIREYEAVVPEFAFRLKVKAGLTGYAQVYGKYNTTPYDKLKLDLFYIEHYSVLLDIKIIFMTIKAVLSKDNSEGVDGSQKTAMKTE